ncbi:hypothetical protein GOODEAATRI_002378 [Goodea atripinnis]|uniref:Uncharacterized protein n=1 Tax=Goodea atripinnis TaxID=208336 RepID=A0ABV0NIE8_9TELE
MRSWNSGVMVTQSMFSQKHAADPSFPVMLQTSCQNETNRSNRPVHMSLIAVNNTSAAACFLAFRLSTNHFKSIPPVIKSGAVLIVFRRLFFGGRGVLNDVCNE